MIAVFVPILAIPALILAFAILIIWAWWENR